MNIKSHNCITILGPTASGKTHMACLLAYHLNGEIISADSRQVYRELNIGTGKDLFEYTLNGIDIPYHLIDICDANTPFYLHDFIRELRKSFNDICSRNKLPIICGGTGLYLEALEKDHSYTQIPENNLLRQELLTLSKAELIEKLNSLGNSSQIQQTDRSSAKRIIRGIEIAYYLKEHDIQVTDLPYKPKYIGVHVSNPERNARIDNRLKERIEYGLIDEVKGLLQKGISHERLQFLGLEYKFISYYLLGKITKEDLFIQLSTAIHQFAKRQMTWFRRMERKGIQIEWINPASYSLEQLIQLLT